MKALILQHASSEGPGLVEPELAARGWNLDRCHLWENAALPKPNDYSLIVILGGAMNIYQHRDFPWLIPEKAWLETAIEAGCHCLGICLGAQLLADVLGGKVMQNPAYEVGWWPVDFTAAAQKRFPGLPPQTTFMHWHGDTFSLPPDATPLASTPACLNQGFLWQQHVLAWQFHPEVDHALATSFADDSGGPWPEGPYVQQPAALISGAPLHLPESTRILRLLLDQFLPAEPKT
jgi:GMP synthase-like glutamine amidotransferase